MLKYTARGIAVARSQSPPYTAAQIDHGNIAEAADLNDKPKKPKGVDFNVPEDKSINTLGRYGAYQTPSALAKSARKGKMKYKHK